MKFEIDKSLQILERTPALLSAMLPGLSDEWLMNNEGGDSWSPYDIIGHLAHGERADWVERIKKILSDSKDKNFVPFDRFAQFEESKGKSMDDLLSEFGELRQRNIDFLRSININENTLDKTGIHPRFGGVTLRQLLATWVVHDLNHIAQIARVMAKQYKEEVGPWIEYLPVLTR